MDLQARTEIDRCEDVVKGLTEYVFKLEARLKRLESQYQQSRAPKI